MKYRFLFVLFVAFFLPLLAGASEIDRVVKTETDFAATATRIGTRAAFLQFLAEDSILFRPGPVPGKQWMEGQKETEDLLTWQPAFVELASGEDLAYTTGPWQYAETRSSDPVAFGVFLTIWKKQNDNSWKAILDLGTRSKLPVPLSPEIQRVSLEKTASFSGNALNLDRDFTELQKVRGETEAYRLFASDRIRLLRDGKGVITGKAPALLEIAELQQKGLFTALGGGESKNGDLAYAYGTRENTDTGEIGEYLRIWSFENGSYKIVADVLAQLRKKQN